MSQLIFCHTLFISWSDWQSDFIITLLLSSGPIGNLTFLPGIIYVQGAVSQPSKMYFFKFVDLF